MSDFSGNGLSLSDGGKANELGCFLKKQLKANTFGLFFSETGKLNLCKRFGLTPNELDAAIESVRSEAVGHGK